MTHCLGARVHESSILGLVFYGAIGGGGGRYISIGDKHSGVTVNLSS